MNVIYRKGSERNVQSELGLVNLLDNVEQGLSSSWYCGELNVGTHAPSLDGPCRIGCYSGDKFGLV